MTERLRGVYVAFERDIREDDVGPLLTAIQLLRGVASVKPDVADPMDFVAHERARSELIGKILGALKEV